MDAWGSPLSLFDKQVLQKRDPLIVFRAAEAFLVCLD